MAAYSGVSGQLHANAGCDWVEFVFSAYTPIPVVFGSSLYLLSSLCSL